VNNSALGTQHSALGHAGWVAPHYDGLGIANVAPAMLHALEIEDPHPGLDLSALPAELLQGVRRVVCLIVDALGYRQLVGELEREPDLCLARLVRSGEARLATLTSVFPSTTTTALPTLHGGTTPAEHGGLGYTLYLRELGTVTEMIRFGPYAGPWSFADAGVDPTAFLFRPPIWSRLEAAAVGGYVVNFLGFRGSALTRILATGAEFVGYANLSHLAVRLRALLEQPTPERMLVVAYYGAYDELCHFYGTGSPEARAELAAIDHALQRELLEPRERLRLPHPTLCLLVADHGQLDTRPERTIELADHPELLEDLTAIAGESRARYLHVRLGREPAVRECLADRFGEMSTAVEARQAFETGLFGPAYSPVDGAPEKPADAVVARAGDLILLPHENWAFNHSMTERQRTSRLARFVGRHGGLTPEEMLVPLLAMRLR
jgi:hypothetical protein